MAKGISLIMVLRIEGEDDVRGSHSLLSLLVYSDGGEAVVEEVICLCARASRQGRKHQKKQGKKELATYLSADPLFSCFRGRNPGTELQAVLFFVGSLCGVRVCVVKRTRSDVWIERQKRRTLMPCFVCDISFCPFVLALAFFSPYESNAKIINSPGARGSCVARRTRPLVKELRKNK